MISLFRRTVFSLVLAAATVPVASAQPATPQRYVTGHPTEGTIVFVARAFKKTLNEAGISGVAAVVQKCYDTVFESKNGIASCMLYDLTAVRFDNLMRKLFVSRGMRDPGPPAFFAPNALAARVQTYGVLAFGPDLTAVGRYFGDAPTKVINHMDFGK